MRDGRLGARDQAAVRRHVGLCSDCSAQDQADRRLDELAAKLHGAPGCPSALELRRLRGRVLHVAAASETRNKTRRRAAILGALAAALAAAVVLHRGAPSGGARPVVSNAALAGAVSGAPDSRWTQWRDGPREAVRLERGRIHVHVRHQLADERFVVELPDGDLEVRGTTFDVAASAVGTERVDVQEGMVVLRIRGGTDVVLHAGDHWERATENAGDPVRTPEPPSARAETRTQGEAVAPRRSPGRRVQSDATVSAGSGAAAGDRAEGDGAESYAQAIALLQAGRYADAADAFHAFSVKNARSSQAEDASFLEAVALSRAGRPDAAALAAERHLDTFPMSFHGKDAAVLVARAARDRGECDKARAILSPYRGDALVDAALGRCRAGRDNPPANGVTR